MNWFARLLEKYGKGKFRETMSVHEAYELGMEWT